ncbi:MAG: DUF924 domain-containing protein [Rhodocyclaceae bacterium]|nr:DUF924 domain-containing protein [Rhodocyclaceae bacterium]
MTGEPTDSPAAVLHFWFGPEPLEPRQAWFSKDPAFDAAIGERFGDRVEEALAGGLTDWRSRDGGPLARVLLLDQFTRNLHRGSARAFAGDPLARAEALALIDAGLDQALPPLQRVFVYLPLEHAEDPGLQRRSVSLFEALAQASPPLAAYADFARRHQAVVERFGRFPHRNRALGRASTAAERAWLAQPGSGF